MELTLARPRVEWPGCEIIADHEDLTESEWRQLRRSGIGGSDAGAIMQVSKYASPLTICMDKTGRGEDFEGNEATEVGNILEPLIRDYIVVPYLGDHGVPIADIGAVRHTYRSKQWPWMMANIDGFIDLDGSDPRRVGLEIKTGGSYQLADWGGMDGNEVPDTYYAQVQHYMAVTGSDLWIVFGLIGNRRLYRNVPRNEAYIANLVEEEREVWHAIETNDPLHFPAPIGLDAEDAAIRALSTPMTDEDVDLSHIETIIERYQVLGNEIKDMTKAKKEAQQIIKATMGRARTGHAGRYTVTRTAYVKQQFDAAQYAKDHPDEVADYMREIEIDFPRVKEAK